jgi:hypothetical protein
MRSAPFLRLPRMLKAKPSRLVLEAPPTVSVTLLKGLFVSPAQWRWEAVTVPAVVVHHPVEDEPLWGFARGCRPTRLGGRR